MIFKTNILATAILVYLIFNTAQAQNINIDKLKFEKIDTFQGYGVLSLDVLIFKTEYFIKLVEDGRIPRNGENDTKALIRKSLGTELDTFKEWFLNVEAREVFIVINKNNGNSYAAKTSVTVLVDIDVCKQVLHGQHEDIGNNTDFHNMLTVFKNSLMLLKNQIRQR